MTRIPLVYGVAPFGDEGAAGVRIHNQHDAQAIIDYFVSKGHKEFDSSRIYAGGTSEKLVGKLDLKGALIDTKAAPLAPGAFAPAKLRESLTTSVEMLGPHKINIFYLHLPDRATPIADTLGEVDRLYKEGHFKEFGLSNYNSWEVAEIVMLCEAKGWVKPTVYQGKYNAIERSVETELFPCLRKFGIRFDAYSPLAGGLFGTKIKTAADMDNSKGTRWDKSVSPYAGFLQAHYKPLIPVFSELTDALVKHGLNPVDAAQRWLQHHSQLTPQDAVILGASALAQLQESVTASEGGPLPEDVLKIMEDAGAKAKGLVGHYAL